MTPILIRPFRPGDEPALRSVFHASVHGLACAHYSPEQLAAWAQRDCDAAQWAERMQANQPFVGLAGEAGAVAGFADLQANGYIDMFFVAPAHARQGVARALMAHLHQQAALRGNTDGSVTIGYTAEQLQALLQDAAAPAAAEAAADAAPATAPQGQ